MRPGSRIRPVARKTLLSAWNRGGAIITRHASDEPKNRYEHIQSWRLSNSRQCQRHQKIYICRPNLGNFASASCTNDQCSVGYLRRIATLLEHSTVVSPGIDITRRNETCCPLFPEDEQDHRSTTSKSPNCGRTFFGVTDN
jgi:hypothetical protein